jgi:hypothetical protein
MTPEKLQSIAFKWFESFNNKELEKLSLYDDDAVHFSPKLKCNIQSDGFVSGKALRSWWKDAFERLPSLNYKIAHRKWRPRIHGIYQNGYW